MTLEHFIFAGGIIQLGILIGSATVPGVLRWADELKAVSLVSRQLIWVHGAFIVLVIIGFGMLAILFPKELAAGAPMSRGVCAFIGLFWLVRLLLQFVLFDPKPLLTSVYLRCGYHGLTIAFTYLAAVFLWGALY